MSGWYTAEVMSDINENCLFCDIIVGNLPAEIVASNEEAVAFRDIHPCAPTHVLVIPKGHIDNALSIEAAHMSQVIKIFELAHKVAEKEHIEKTGFRLVFNVGEDADNSVAHLHMHLIGGKRLGPMA